MTGIFESHAHYEDEAFDEDRDVLLKSLPENGIKYVVDVGSSIDTCHKIIELIPKWDYMYGALGIHPEEIRTVTNEDMEWLRKEAAANGKIVAIGEIGLDYYWDKDNKEQQKEFFERQLLLAKELKKPVIVHSREAALDTYEVIKASADRDNSGVIHCFSYSKEEAKNIWIWDFILVSEVCLPSKKPPKSVKWQNMYLLTGYFLRQTALILHLSHSGENVIPRYIFLRWLRKLQKLSSLIMMK